MFKKLRVAVLLYILLIVAVTSWSNRARNTDWSEPLWVVVYPINGEGNIRTAAYIDNLAEADFRVIEDNITRQGKNYGIKLAKPVRVKLAPEVESMPPIQPRTKNPFAIALWSLRLRYWAWSVDTFDGPADIRLFTLYYDPESRHSLAHSLGLQKGFLGVVHGFGTEEYSGRNNVVLVHEMLHTLGASDKYDPRSNQSIFPIGYADPEQTPLYPQKRAEIMAGRIPLSADEEKMPRSLSEVTVGPTTALEIGWSD